jgi:hypothetical protein
MFMLVTHKSFWAYAYLDRLHVYSDGRTDFELRDPKALWVAGRAMGGEFRLRHEFTKE